MRLTILLIAGLLSGCQSLPRATLETVRGDMMATCQAHEADMGRGLLASRGSKIYFSAYSLRVICNELYQGHCPLGMVPASAEWVRDYAGRLRDMLRYSGG